MQIHPIGLLSTPAAVSVATPALSGSLRWMISRHHRAEAGQETSGVINANLDVT
jgi:hypothetical protein